MSEFSGLKALFGDPESPPSPPENDTIIVDVDGTVADMTHRLEKADAEFERASSEWYDEIMRDDFYHWDKPISGARLFLKAWPGKVIYMTGRREGSDHKTAKWLHEHGFPYGWIFHRRQGRSTQEFKTDLCKYLMTFENLNIVAGYGDRDIDINAYTAAGIPAIKIGRDGSGWRLP